MVAENDGFAPLEQSAGQVRSCCDIYSLGMVAIQALTGQQPQILKKDMATGVLIWNDQGQTRETLAGIVDKMVHPNWVQRYQSAEDVIADLKPVIQSWQHPM